MSTEVINSMVYEVVNAKGASKENFKRAPFHGHVGVAVLPCGACPS